VQTFLKAQPACRTKDIILEWYLLKAV
jgi:hypothetical protein